jgi:uncharacterized membrane protein
MTVSSGSSFERQGILLGLAAGIFSAVSTGAFFKAMELGAISIASSFLGLGSIFAFALSVASGERPGALALGGAGLALSGAVITSVGEHASGGNRRTALVYALLSTVGFGFTLYLIGLASNQTGSAVAVLSQRVSSSLVLLLMMLRLRVPFQIDRRWLIVTLGIGTGTAGALFLFGLAADIGLIAIASVLSSLYPVVAIVLARIFLGERLHGLQPAGVLLVLGGIAVVAFSR